MKTPFYTYCFKQDCGQAIVAILILIGIATLSIATISKIALWRLDATLALINQQKIISNWESKRTEIIKSSFPTNSFKRLNFQNNSLAVPVIPKKDLSVESLRVPVFSLGDADNPLLNWEHFLKGGLGSCKSWLKNACSEVQLIEKKSLVRGNIKSDSITIKSGLNVIAATGEISISDLVLEEGATLEIVSAFDLYIKDLTLQRNSKAFLKSVYGQIRIPSIDSLECNSDSQIKTSSIHPIQLKNKVLKTAGCSSVSLSDYWQSIRFLGNLSQKTLNSVK